MTRVNTETQSKLEQLFNAAADKGFLKPKLNIAGYTYKRAPDNGRNVGAVYVTDSEDATYLGKIIHNVYYPMHGTNTAELDLIAEAMRDPQTEAIKWGHETGECAICGRRLDNKESVARGIGPICAEKIGFISLDSDSETDTDLDDMI